MTDNFEKLTTDVESAFEQVNVEREIMLRKELVCQERGVPYFKCPDCGAVSPSPDDIANSYCYRCHAFKGDGFW